MNFELVKTNSGFIPNLLYFFPIKTRTKNDDFSIKINIFKAFLPAFLDNTKKQGISGLINRDFSLKL